MFIQRIEAFFRSLEAMGLNLPLFVLVPLIMILAIVGTVILVKAIQWLIKLVLGEKGKRFIDSFTDFTMHVDEQTKDLANNGKHTK